MEVTKKIPSLRFPGFEGEWEEKEFLDVFDSISTKKFQIKTSENKEFGLYEVVDQGQSPISGYSDESSKLFKQTPVILYGDHTTIVKFRTTPFIVGADGVKLLKETSQKNDLKFLYHCLCFNNVNPEGYKRHFSILKTKSLNIAPSLPEQQKIADCLTAMDDTIEAQQQKVEQLQLYKKGLLQQLFSQTSRFPGFKGEWEEKKLGEVLLSVTTGLNPRDNFILGDGDNFYITIKNIKNGKLYLETAEKIDNAATQTINKRSDLRAGDVLFSSIGNVGDMYIIEEDPKKWNINESVFSLRPNTNSITSKQLYYSIQNPAFMNLLRSGVTGSTFKSVKIGFLKNIKLDLPSLPEQQKIADCLSLLDEVIELEQQKLEKLQAYKKGLLQQLFV